VTHLSISYTFEIQPGLTRPVYAPIYAPHAINDLGQIAGTQMLRGPASGFVYGTITNVTRTDVVPAFPDLGTTFSGLGGINDVGQFAGWIIPLAGGGPKGVLIHDGTAESLFE